MTGSARRPTGWSRKARLVAGYAATVSPLTCVQLANDLGAACLADTGPGAVAPAVEAEPRRRQRLFAALPAQWWAYVVQLVLPGAGPAAGQVVTAHEALVVAVVALAAALPTPAAGSSPDGQETRFAVLTLDRPGTLGRTGPSGGTSPHSGTSARGRTTRQGGEAMKPIQQAIEVRVPVHTAYERLSRFECYPQFMTGVQEVRQVSDEITHWVMDLDGRRTEFDAMITDCRLDERVAWKATGGAAFSEAITLKPLAADRTQVIAELEADAQALLPSDKHATESLKKRLKADLTGFKRYVEQHSDASAEVPPAASPATLARGSRGMRTQGRAGSPRRAQPSALTGEDATELDMREGSADL
jgi:uncharacterized membrane protein